MKLHQSSPAGRNAFTGYGEGYVQVNGDRFDSSILVLPDAPVSAWGVATLAELDEQRVEELARLDVEIVLIGTGPALRFPPASLLLPLARAGIGWEIMDSAAACRTYNILMGEGRKVAAAVMLGGRSRP